MIVALYFAVLVAFSLTSLYKLALVALYFRNRRAEARPEPLPARLPFVTVQLPLYNERGVVERLLRAVTRLDYPKDRLEIQVLDDSTDETSALVERLADGYRREGWAIFHLRRLHRRHFKAGALADGLLTARGELVTIFDADFVPPTDFLLRTIGSFARPEVGMVQARWGYLNEAHSVLTRAQALFLDGHFVIEHGARSRSGLFFNFNGTAGIWRREAIDSAGGWSGETLTEDLDLSYRAQMRGWRFVYLPCVEVPSELPESLPSLKAQQFRWAKGMTQVAVKLLVPLWRSPIGWRRKCDATLHLISGVGYLSTSLAAILLVPFLLQRSPISRLPGLALLALNLGGSVAYYLIARKRPGLRDLATALAMIPIGIGLSLNGSRAVLEALLGRSSPFQRTPKTGYRPARARGSAVELSFLAFYLVAVSFALGRAPLELPPLLLFGSGYLWLVASSRKAPL